ncbi:hypothetical protein IFM89_032156 [Coptis chinensis]|uniref:Uncharacterized protein n=1 Tax=Coptis chinensis TaxID=261450 RepID=A0A835J117_9MAGN|nr:hypothetical protein IFM89_032156 [Coptis chinensis]
MVSPVVETPVGFGDVVDELSLLSGAPSSIAPLRPGAPTNQPFSWSSLFSTSRVASQDTRLEQFEINEVDGISDVPFDLIMRGETVWREYLVGFFSRAKIWLSVCKICIATEMEDEGII